jgi:hypothetical protein
MNGYSNRQASLVRPDSLLDRGLSRLVDGMERVNKHPRAVFAGAVATIGVDVLTVAATDIEASSAAPGGIAIGALIVAQAFASEAYDDFRHRND